MRSRFAVVIHRMVSCLEPSALVEALPAALPLLVQGMPAGDDSARDLDIIFPLLNQLMIHVGARLVPVLDPWLLPLLAKTLELLPPPGESAPHVASLVAGVQRQYLALLHHVATHGLEPVLVSDANRPYLDQLLGLVVGGLAQAQDPLLKKVCLSILGALRASWLVSPPPAGVDQRALVAFLAQRAVPAALATLVAPEFRPKDANCVRLLGEVAAFVSAVDRDLASPEFRRHLVDVALPALAFPPDLARRVGESLAGSEDGSALEATLRAAIAPR